MDRTGAVQHLNPAGMHQNPAFTQVIAVSGPVRTIYVGGQNAVNAAGEIVGKGDFGTQTRQILENIGLCLAAAGAGFEHMIKLNILMVEGQPLAEGFAVFQEVVGTAIKPPLVTGAFVAGLAHPDFLAEIEVIAIVPE